MRGADQPQFCQVDSNDPFDTAEKAGLMVADILPAIEAASGGAFSYAVTNCDRSIGARLSGEIAKRHGNSGMESNPITVNLTGTAGQSFGVWNAGGLHMYLRGDCNDYVGKGMAGGKLVIAPPEGSVSKVAKPASLAIPVSMVLPAAVCLPRVLRASASRCGTQVRMP